MSPSWVLPIWLLAAGVATVQGVGTPPARLGQACLSEGQCTRSVANSTCSSGTCSCKPYFAEHDGSCLPSTLLGLPCRVDGQCRLKVANSSCLKGTCDCDAGFLRFRRHTCLPPAHLGEICYSDSHCRLADTHLYCDFIIRNLLGRCRCQRFTSAGHDHSHGPCTLHNTLPGEEPVTEPFTPTPASISFTEISSSSASTTAVASIFTLPPSKPTKSNFQETTPTTPAPVTSTALTASTTPLTTLQTKDNVISDMFPLSTVMSPTPNKPLESWQSLPNDIETTTGKDSLTFTTTSTTTKEFIDELSNTIVDHHPFQDKDALRRKGDGDVAVSLGWLCHSDNQCQAADPDSRCIQGICDCPQKNNTHCRASNTGCHSSTFQCRSNGQCLSWFYVCDGQRDCPDGSDEACGPSEGCPGPKGMAFRCSNGKCITRAARCDGRYDCEGGEDEHGCLPQGNKRIGCPGNAFQCHDGQCLPEYEFCNAIIGCKDGSDELSSICGSPFHFKVSRINTRKARDEDTCPFRCRNGRCRSSAIVCSGRDGCGDNSDEINCKICRCGAS